MKKLHQSTSKDYFIQLFEIPIYDSVVCFLRYNNKKGYEYCVKYCEGLGVEDMHELLGDDYMNCYGFTMKEKTKNRIVSFLFMNNCKEYKDSYINTLSHENFHLIEGIAKHHNLEDCEHNEARAYLTGYVFNYLFNL